MVVTTEQTAEPAPKLASSKGLVTRIQTTLLDEKLDVRTRLSAQQEWQREYERRVADFDVAFAELDIDIDQDLQIWDMLEEKCARLELLKVKLPLEVSARAIRKPGSLERLHSHLTNQYMGLTKEEKLQWLMNLRFIMTRDLKEVDKKIKTSMGYRILGQQRNFLVGGPSGMGKTTFTNYLLIWNSPYVDVGRNVVPVIKVDAPANNLTALTLVQRLIEQCGMSYLNRDTEERLLKKLRAYLRICGVQLIIVDEVEHIRSPLMKRRLLEISNKRPDIPIICTSCKPHLWVHGVGDNGELAGRWPDQVTLHPYTGDRLVSLLTFVQLLLPLSGESYLDKMSVAPTKDHPGMQVGPAKLIEDWTGGIMKHIMALLYGATARAIATNMPALTPELLTKTWTDLRKKELEKQYVVTKSKRRKT
jgi:hypothetical protein